MAVILNFFRKGGNKGGNDKGKPEKETFKEFTEMKGGDYWAASFLRGPYATKPGSERWAQRKIWEMKMKNLDDAKKTVESSSVPEEKKKVLMDLLTTVKKDDAWDIENSIIATLNHADGTFNDKQFDYVVRALNAWRSGKIKEFAQKEKEALDSNGGLSKKERNVLGEMFDLVLEKDEIAIAIVTRNVIFYQFDKEPAEEKIKKAEKSLDIFKHL